MFWSCQIIIKELCSLLKVYYSVHNSIRICRQGVVVAYHVMWECVVEQWLGVRRMLSNKRLSIFRSLSLYTEQWYMSCRFADSLRAESERKVPSWSCSQPDSQTVWRIPLLCIRWKTRDDGQKNCPKHVEFYSKNVFEKLVHLFGFIIRISHDAPSPERQMLLPTCNPS